MSLFGPRVAYDLSEHSITLCIPGEKDPIGCFRRLATCAEGHLITGKAFGLTDAQDLPGEGVLTKYKDENGYFITAFHDVISESDSGMVVRVRARWKADQPLEKVKCKPHSTEQYTYEYEPCQDEVGKIRIKIKADSFFQHGLLFNYTSYIKPQLIEQLHRAVQMMEKHFPADPSSSDAKSASVIVTGEKILSDLTLKPAITVQGVVTATAVGCPTAQAGV